MLPNTARSYTLNQETLKPAYVGPTTQVKALQNLKKHHRSLFQPHGGSSHGDLSGSTILKQKEQKPPLGTYYFSESLTYVQSEQTADTWK